MNPVICALLGFFAVAAVIYLVGLWIRFWWWVSDGKTWGLIGCLSPALVFGIVFISIAAGEAICHAFGAR